MKEPKKIERVIQLLKDHKECLVIGHPQNTYKDIVKYLNPKWYKNIAPSSKNRLFRYAKSKILNIIHRDFDGLPYFDIPVIFIINQPFDYKNTLCILGPVCFKKGYTFFTIDDFFEFQNICVDEGLDTNFLYGANLNKKEYNNEK